MSMLICRIVIAKVKPEAIQTSPPRGCLKSPCSVIASEAKQARALVFNGLLLAKALAMTAHKLLRQLQLDCFLLRSSQSQ